MKGAAVADTSFRRCEHRRMRRETAMIRRVFVVLGALALFTILSNSCFAKEITVRGKLQRTVEAGGWLIVAEKQRYLILNPQKFQNETWFKEGTDVEATGETKKVMTIYMEGIPFEVSALRPASDTQSVITSLDGKALTVSLGPRAGEVPGGAARRSQVRRRFEPFGFSLIL
jgi:hypothetical protein